MTLENDFKNKPGSSRPGHVDDDSPKLPFVTTSDVLHQLNKNLKELAVADGDIMEGLEPRFELQKRLPDGSTIPASAADMAASDFNNKLQQSAKFVTEYLKTDEDRAAWAEQQRLVGNVYFTKADYRAAMDIYLTCLVVKKKQDDQEQHSAEFLNHTFLPVLNNLAQCTLQLSMHKKTIEFCTLALDEINKSSFTANTSIDPIAKCKLYFKRAKARRLTGFYSLARTDLNDASSCLDLVRMQQQGDGDDVLHANTVDESSASLKSYRQAIQKEFRLLELAEKEARRNRQRQKAAMQKALVDKGIAESSSSSSMSKDPSSNIEPLDQCKVVRNYSTLRARKPEVSVASQRSVDGEDGGARSNRHGLTYWQYYCLVVARVAEMLLLWMGDEETKDKIKERME